MPRRSLPDLPSNFVGHMFLQPFQRKMQRLIEQFRNGFPMPELPMGALDSGAGFPAVDAVEKDDTMEMNADLPWIREADLDVSISGDVLTLKGEKGPDHEESQDSFHLVERRHGSFRRQIPLGFAPEGGATEAHLADGVLKLRIANFAAAKAGVQKINISRK